MDPAYLDILVLLVFKTISKELNVEVNVEVRDGHGKSDCD